MNSETPEKFKLLKKYYQLIRGVAIVAGVFSSIICLLMILNFFQTKSIDPLNSPALDRLIKQLDQNPQNDALRTEIRALDLLSRKAYFTSLWQLETGSFLLLGGVIIFLAGLKLSSNLKKQLPNPTELKPLPSQWLADSKARQIALIAGVALLVVALLAGILSRNDLKNNEVFASSATFASPEEVEKNWPNFRGPWGNAHAFVKNIPTKWNGKNGENILWKIESPKQGYGSPVVWEDRIFMSGGDQKVREVYCFSATDGKLLWQKPVPLMAGAPPETVEIPDGTGYAASTVATNGQQVIAIFGTGELVCFNLNGDFLWGQNLGVPDNHYGHSSSLMVHENLLFVQMDDKLNPRLLAFEAASGKFAWESKRDEISWASPILVNTGKRIELILANSKNATSYNPATSKKYWSLDCLSGEVGPSAVFADGMVFVANEYAQAVGIQINSDGTVKEAWTYTDNLPNTSSPVATDKYLFLCTSDGYLSCLNAKTGEVVWEQEFDYGFYASPIVVGELVYLIDLKGILHIFKVADKYESIAENVLGEGTSCTPAFAEGRIFLRGDKNLYCIGTKQ